MGFWQRFVGSEEPQHKDPQQLVPILVTSYRAEKQLTQQILAHAELAPHQAGRDTLRIAAQEQERIAQRIQDKIVELEGKWSGEAAEAAPKEGHNHWSRVVRDLEDSQTLTQQYNEQAIYWDPDLPGATQFFLSLEKDKQRLNAFLRDIALRADPHAVN